MIQLTEHLLRICGASGFDTYHHHHSNRSQALHLQGVGDYFFLSSNSGKIFSHFKVLMVCLLIITVIRLIISEISSVAPLQGVREEHLRTMALVVNYDMHN